jgi:hypothetical protein
MSTSVSWGRRERYKFASCGNLNGWVPPVVPAVFAITYKQDPHNLPKTHTVLYFGECEDLSKQAVSLNRKVVDFWMGNGGTEDDLYVFVHQMDGSSKFDRSKVQERLVAEYQPHVNDM